MADQETYAEKIAKLLRKAESTTPEEAELLFAKAQELMTKYAIDEAMINAARGTSREREPIVSEEFVITGIYRFPLGDLTYRILLANGIKAILLSDAGPRIVGERMFKQTYVLMAVGFKSDLDAARVLEASLHIQALRAESEWWRKNESNYSHLGKSTQHLQRRQFLQSFSHGAYEKMKGATKRGREAAEEQRGKNSVALVLIDKDKQVENEYDRLFPSRQNINSRRKGGGSNSVYDGITAGLNADVGQPGLKGRKALNR